jgi:Zn-dependent oligopeptidase
MPVIKIKDCLNCHIEHEWLFNGATLMELRTIKQLTGMNGKDFATGGDDLEPEALAALVYILHKRSKITIPFENVDLDFNDFEMIPTDEELAAIEELEKAMQKAAEAGQVPK